MRKKLTCIINPVSGTRKKDALPALIRMMFHHEYELEITNSNYPGHARELAAKAVEENTDILLVAGGDGTINEVAGELVYTGIPLGIIPAGSGNGLARHLGIPLSHRLALRVIDGKHIRSIDSGLIDKKPFFCTAGIGFDAFIGKEFLHGNSRGFYGYVNHVIREYLRYRPFKYALKYNGDSFEKEAFVITLANAGQYGNNAFIAPHADITDGFLDLCLIKDFPKFKVIEMGLRLFNKTLTDSEYYSYSKITHARIETDGEHYFHHDGEVALFTNSIDVKVLPMSLDVFVPGNRDR